MAFSGNDLPIGPAGGFPRQRISSYGNMLVPVRDAEERYLKSPVAKLPTVEKEYSSVVKRATGHLNFGEKATMTSPIRKMGGGFKGEDQRKKLVQYAPMPGHGNGRSVNARGPLYKIRSLERGVGPRATPQTYFPSFGKRLGRQVGASGKLSDIKGRSFRQIFGKTGRSSSF